jgi:hypothetical protein
MCDIQTALVLSKDEILLDGDVQPLDAHQLKVWCENCAEGEVVKVCEALPIHDQNSCEDDVFGYCGYCQKAICRGSTMRSLTASEEKIADNDVCIPINVEYLSYWCEACEPKAQERLSQHKVL